ncbi:MAG: caspase family protein [Phycisphaeraceae bacterium]|nr:caspase family protein [Phycisphaeraceae bacterium]
MSKYALLVGVSRYSDPDITDLNFAANDALDIGTCLRERCGFDEVQILATGGQLEPDLNNVVDALHNLAPRLSTDDLLLFFFAGHGIQTDQESYLLTSNSRIRMPQLTSVPSSVLANCLSAIPCRDRVLIFDACRNNPRAGRGDEDNVLTNEFSRDIMTVAETAVGEHVPTTFVLFSCRTGERAYEWPYVRHGAFSHYLIEGLRGDARDDQGRITIHSLGTYVQDRVPQWAQANRTPLPQVPWVQQQGALRDIVLVVGQPPPAPVQAPIAEAGNNLGQQTLQLTDTGVVHRGNNNWLTPQNNYDLHVGHPDGTRAPYRLTWSAAFPGGAWRCSPTIPTLLSRRGIAHHHLSGDTPCDVPVTVHQRWPAGQNPPPPPPPRPRGLSSPGMTIHSHLRRRLTAPMPRWLADFSEGMPFSAADFFESRIVYYPGAGSDGQPVKLFGSSHSTHCFIYVDYGIEQRQVKADLDHPQVGFAGYRCLARIRLTEADLVPHGWEPHIDFATPPEPRYSFASATFYGFLQILEREEDFDEEHGPKRLAIVFLGADGIATFDALFCQRTSIGVPFAVVLQDHGFGGNYDNFGGGGLLERIALSCNVLPRFLLVADNTNPWRGYVPIPGLGREYGGAGPHWRRLFQR